VNEACPVNIDARGIRARRLGGLLAAAFAVALVVAMVVLGLPRWTRLYAFAPFWLGALGWFQAHEKTCIRLAGSGLRETDAGLAKVEDDAELAQLRAQARRVHLEAAAAAAVLTAAALLLPA
jgi:hypothetical protein